MRELGYAEGQNITIEREFAGPNIDRLHELAAELVKSKVDVILALSSTAARPAKQATSVIPIVAIAMATQRGRATALSCGAARSASLYIISIVRPPYADPVEDELVASLARPSGNVTGTTFLGPELIFWDH